MFAVLALPVGGPARRSSFGVQFTTQIITWGLWLALAPLVLAITRRVHAMGIATLRGIVTHMGAGVCIAFVHAVLFSFLRWVVLVPQNDVRAVVAATVGFVYGSDILKYVLIASLFHALLFQRDARDRLLSESRLSALLAQSRLEVLEARLHPHFLFNTLNAITALIRKDPPSAIVMVENLGDLLRAALRGEPGKMVSLSTEYELLRQYVAIQQARFSDRLTVKISATPEALAVSVPQLILQPLVENAIEHGIAPREAPGEVIVDAWCEENQLVIFIADDGVGDGWFEGPRTNGAGHGMGISNTRARLAAVYGEQFRFDMAGQVPHGTAVAIRVPVHGGSSRAINRPAQTERPA